VTAPTPSHAPASGEPPLAPPPPVLPSTTDVGGSGSCSSSGAGYGSPRGTGGPSVAVLGSTADQDVPAGGTEHAAPAAGSPTLSANDPATRPD
jgi:hypothetical protein